MQAFSLLAVIAALIVAVLAADTVFTTTPSIGYVMSVQSRTQNELYVASRSGYIYKLLKTGSQLNPSGYSTTTLYSQNSPTDVELDTNGNMYISEQSSHTVKKVVLSNLATTVLGTSLGDPYGVAWCSLNNKLYVTSYSLHRVYEIGVNGGVAVYSGTGSSGSSDGYRTSATWASPMANDVLDNGDLYVGNTGGGSVRLISYSTGMVTTPISPSSGWGVSRSLDGGIYHHTHHTMYRWFNGVNTVKISATSGYLDGPALSSAFALMWGMTARTNGFLYMADHHNNVIRGCTNTVVSTPNPVSYCCQPVYSECAAIHASCNLLDVAPLLAACNNDSALCGVYNLAVAVKNSCNRLASDCDALISGC